MNTLQFTPYAWSKLLYLRDKGNTEVSFFAVSRKESLDVVEDLFMPFQYGEWATTEFVEEKLPLFFDSMVDAGYHPEEFARIWCHTHPGTSASPSGKDESTFSSEFAGPNWAIMFIVGKEGATTCRLRYKCHPDLNHILPEGSSQELSVQIAWGKNSKEISDTVRASWDAEYSERLLRKSYKSPIGFYQNAYTADKTENDTTLGSWKPGPGWRRTPNDRSWLYKTEWANEDYNRCIFNSSDYERIYGKAGAFVDESVKKLTRREKKRLRRYGSLESSKGRDEFQKYVPIEKLERTDEAWIDEVAAEWEANQKLLEQTSSTKYWTVVLDNGERRYNIEAPNDSRAMDYVDEDIFSCSMHVPYACAIYALEQATELNEQKWEVTLDDGTNIRDVPGFDEVDAINKCHIKLKRGSYCKGDDELLQKAKSESTSTPAPTLESSMDSRLGLDPMCYDIC